MKIWCWLQLVFIFLEVTIFLTPEVECFTIPISVSTGMAIIMALVKVKAVIVKVLLGLKIMGYESFVWRANRRRRRDLRGGVGVPVLKSSPDDEGAMLLLQDELVEAWDDLQQTVGKVIQFDLESCLAASMSRSSSTNEDWLERHIFSHENNANQSSDLRNKTRDKEYSIWVSKTLGSSIKDPAACQILAEKLLQQPIITSNGNTTQASSSETKR